MPYHLSMVMSRKSLLASSKTPTGWCLGRLCVTMDGHPAVSDCTGMAMMRHQSRHGPPRGHNNWSGVFYFSCGIKVWYNIVPEYAISTRTQYTVLEWYDRSHEYARFTERSDGVCCLSVNSSPNLSLNKVQYTSFYRYLNQRVQTPSKSLKTLFTHTKAQFQWIFTYTRSLTTKIS